MFIAADLNEEILNRVLFESWPSSAFCSLTTKNDIEEFYKKAYKNFETRLEFSLKKGSATGWVVEAFNQIELWTLIFHHHRGSGINKLPPELKKCPESWAPIARYGWRYVIDVLMRGDFFVKGEDPQRPWGEDLIDAFTNIMGMSICSELLNFIYYYSDSLDGVTLDFHPSILLRFPSFSGSGGKMLKHFREKISTRIPWSKFPNFSVDSKEMDNKFNKYLKLHHGFTLDEILEFIGLFQKKICVVKGRSLIACHEEWFISQMTGESLSVEKVRAITNFSFLTQNLVSKTRAFFKKTDQARLLNYAGVIIDLKASDAEFINRSFFNEIQVENRGGRHIVATPEIYSDWLDNFKFRLCMGLREDLKSISSEIRSSISEIEEFYHQDIFEKETEKIYQKMGFLTVLNIKTFKEGKLPCGEIDLLAFDQKTNAFIIGEVKILNPSLDIKMTIGEAGKFFDDEGYHKKFMRKIEWVTANMDKVDEIFFERHKINIPKDVIIKKRMITITELPVAEKITEYELVPFYQITKRSK